MSTLVRPGTARRRASGDAPSPSAPPGDETAPAAHDARLARYATPATESVAALRAAVAAARALAALGEALARSPIGAPAREAFAALDAAAALGLDGHDVDPRAVLADPEGRDAAAVRRHLAAREDAVRRARGRDLDLDAVLNLASALAGVRVDLRGREPSVHERASLVSGQRLVRGRERIERALLAWLDFLARSAGEAEPLIVVGEAYRRLLSIRPFARGNLGLAQAASALLLELEGVTAGWTLPLAHRLVARQARHAELLARGEREPEAWLVFWLESVRACAVESHAALVGWERHRERVVRAVGASLRGDGEGAALDALSRPGLTTPMLMDAGGLTRRVARLALEALEREGVLEPVGAGRSRRHVARDLLCALVD